MEINVNGVGKQIQGIAWRIENKIIDRLREACGLYAKDEILDEIEKELTDDAEELDFIGGIIASSTDKDGK